MIGVQVRQQHVYRTRVRVPLQRTEHAAMSIRISNIRLPIDEPEATIATRMARILGSRAT